MKNNGLQAIFIDISCWTVRLQRQYRGGGVNRPKSNERPVHSPTGAATGAAFARCAVRMCAVRQKKPLPPVRLGGEPGNFSRVIAFVAALPLRIAGSVPSNDYNGTAYGSPTKTALVRQNADHTVAQFNADSALESDFASVAGPFDQP